MTNLRPVEQRICAKCQLPFQPKPGGYNAMYCSQSCKARKRNSHDRRIRPEVLSERRKGNYKRLQKDPIKLEAHRKLSREYREEVRRWLSNYKMERGCVDCGYKEHFSALHLDHEGEKSIEIGAARSSISRLQEEIERGKCVVRCANCHAIVTWKRIHGLA